MGPVPKHDSVNCWLFPVLIGPIHLSENPPWTRPIPSAPLSSAPLRSASAQARPRRDRPGAVMLSAAVGCTSKTKQEVTRSHPLEKTELNMSASGSADQI